MYIKFDNNTETGILHLPENERWGLYYSFTAEGGGEECSLYVLTESGDKIMVLNADDWIAEYPSLSFQFQSLYEEIVDRVAKMLCEKVEPRFLDLPAMEQALIKENEPTWIKKGQLVVDEDGNWQ